MPTTAVNTLDPHHSIDASQRRAARVVGFLYLLLMATGAFAQIYVPGTFPGGTSGIGGAVETARAIVDSERLLRLGTVVDPTNVVVLQLLSGSDEMRALTEGQVAALVWVAMSSHTIGYSLGLVFLGLGSAVFSYLLFRSRYVPRRLAAFGIFSSALLAAGSLVTVVFPEATSVVNPALYVPMFFYEVTTGLWLLIRGLR